MEKYIHIKCNEKAKISINGIKTYIVSPSNTLDIIVKKNCYVSCMPTNDEFLPYSFSLQDIKNNDNILKIPFHNNHTDIYFIPTLKIEKMEDTILIDKRYGEHYIKVFSNSLTYINISNEKYSYTKKIQRLTSCNTTIENHLILYGKLKNNNLYYLIFDLENNKPIIDDEFEIVEKDKEKIKLMKNTQNIAKHGIVYEYDIKTGFVDNYSIYIDETPRTTNIIKAIPYAFIEAIKLNDFNLAKSYLQDAFVSNDHLKSYFGEVKEIFPNPYTRENNYTLLTTEGYKSYTFEIENSKIKDIEEIQLLD